MLKKLLLALPLLALLFAAALYLAGGRLLGAATRALLPQVSSHSRSPGLQVEHCDFASSSLRPLAHLVWDNWTIRLLRPPLPSAPGPVRFAPLELHIDRVEFTLVGWSPLTGTLEVEGIRLDTPFVPAAPADLPFSTDEFGLAIDRIDAGFLRVPDLPVTLDPAPLAAALARELEQLAREGSTARQLQFGARLHLQVEGRPLAIRLETVRRAGVTRLRFHDGDIAELSRRHARPLTAAEQRLLCDHPQRALLLLRIKEYAERLALRLSRTDRAYGEDFTRHIVWSYWLTRTFGAEFAREVTDAHEDGATDNTPSAHRQDYANNDLGRRYALARKSEQQVLQLIKTDPMVVRSAQ